MFTLLLTVILVVCIGAVAADLLFGPEQPATPTAGSNGERWDPWRRWLRAARGTSRRAAQQAARGTGLAVRALWGGTARLVDILWARPVQASRQALADVGAHRQARRQRRAAHARHLDHRIHLPPPQLHEAAPAPAVAPDWLDEDADDWLDEDAPEPAAAPDWPEPTVPTLPPSGNGYGPPPTTEAPAWAEAETETTLPGWQGNGTPAPAAETGQPAAEPDTTLAGWQADGVPASAIVPAAPGVRTSPEDPTLDLVPPRTAEMPVVSPSRGPGPRADVAVPAPVEARRQAEPGETVPLAVPTRERLRALAILSVLVCVFGVATASLLLVVIVTLTRAVGGV